MKNKILTILITILALCMCMFTLTACVKDVKFKLKFVVDDEIYATIDTSGAEIIQMPENPTKDDYIFDGWFWDKDVWEKPFTANSLLEAPLSNDMSVYAKFTKNHTHEYSVSLNTDNSKAGSVTGSGNYKYEKEITVKATANIGYTFLGWFDGETCVCETADFAFKVEKDVAYVAKFEVKEEMANFNFTSTTTTCQITGIKDKTVTEIIIPNYVTSISSGAFSGCTSLQSITLPFVGAKAGVTSSDTYQYPFGYIFGTTSFSGSNSATQYYYGGSTSSPTSSTYYIPSSLKSVTITGGNILYGAFRDCDSLTSVVIGDSVTSIGSSAFCDCDSLTSIEIPDSVTSIGEYAFSGCSSLTYNIKDGLKYLGNNNNKYIYLADVESNSITSATIDNNCRFIGDRAFHDCTALTSVVIGDSVTSIGEGAFYNCDSLTSIEIPDSVTSIGNYAFYGCYKLTSIVIPDSVTSIGYSAFAWCDSLTSVVIGDSVTSIGHDAFWDCSSLTSVVIPNSVTSIGEYAFSGCSSLTYNVKDGLKYLGNNNNKYLYLADVESKSITSATIDNNCRFIGDRAFSGCDSLTSIVIPDSVTSIGEGAFYNCTSLKSIEIPDSVTSIGVHAFWDCSSLTSVVIPDSVTSIGEGAFLDCDSLTYNVKDGLKYLGNNNNKYLYLADVESNSITSATIDNNCRFIGYYAFAWCDSLTSVVIGDSVTIIGDSAFEDCSSLTSIKYRGTESQWEAITKGFDWNSSTGNYTITYNYTGE